VFPRDLRECGNRCSFCTILSTAWKAGPGCAGETAQEIAVFTGIPRKLAGNGRRAQEIAGVASPSGRVAPGGPGGRAYTIRMRSKPSKGRRARRLAVLLVAPGFEEIFVVACASAMRRAGIPLVLASNRAGVVEGAYALRLKPDATLDDLAGQRPPDLLVFPVGQPCLATLLTDPRVFQLIEMTLAGGGCVSAPREAQEFIPPAYTGNGQAGFIWYPPGERTPFIQQLIDRLTV